MTKFVMSPKKNRYQMERSGCSKISTLLIPLGFGFYPCFIPQQHPEPRGRGKYQDGAKHENHNQCIKQSRITMQCTESTKAFDSPEPDSHLIQSRFYHNYRVIAN